jgi:holo-[acyl-carrier protein] synthase
MKILGVGVDLIENSRIKKSVLKKSFINRIYSKQEIKLAQNKVNKTTYFAKRFAAKEAFAKSLGTGFINNLNFKDITIVNNKLGKPYFLINDKIKKLIKKQFKINNFNFFLSISDEKKYSIAFVVFQK